MRNASHCSECATRHLCLAADLDGAALDRLSHCMTPGEPLQRGEHLYRAGDPADGCYIVRSGVFKTVASDPDGSEHVTGFHYPGDLIAMNGQGEGRHLDSAVALDTSTACRVPLSRLPELWALGSGQQLLALLGRSQQHAAEQQTLLARHGAESRLAGFLVGLARRRERQGLTSDRLPLPMSRTDLANHLGMTLECLSRVLSRLSRRGVITATRREVTQNEPDALRAMARGTSA